MTKILPTDDEELQIALKARELSDHSLLKEVLERLETNVIQEWRAGETPAAREAAHAKLKGIEEFKRQLAILIQRGEVIEITRARSSTSQTVKE